MRKLGIVLAMLLGSVCCLAQTAVITGQAVDPDGTSWVSGTYTITLGPIPAGTTPTRIDNGQNVSPTVQNGTLDGTGSFSVTLTSINNIRPSGLSWTVQVCPNVSNGTCGSIKIQANASGSVSTQLQAVLTAPRISGGIGSYAYTDVEVAAVANNSYFNVGTSNPGCRYYGSSWGNCGSGAGGTVTAVTGTAPIVSSGGTTPAISCPTCGTGTLTAVSVATANGVSGTSSGGATPALTIALGAITPSSVTMAPGGTVGSTDTGAPTLTWSTNLITANQPLAGSSLLSGSPSTAAQSALPTGAHGFACDESSASGTPASGVDYLRCDSTTHSIRASFNDGSEASLSGTVTVNFFTLGSAIATTAAAFTNTLSASIFTVSNPVTFGHIYYDVTTGDGGGAVRDDIAIYSCPSNDCSQPSVTATLVCNLGATVMSSTGQTSGACLQGTVTIQPGTYLDLWTSTASGLHLASSGAPVMPFSAQGLTGSSSGGVAPNTVTTQTAGSEIGNVLAITLH